MSTFNPLRRLPRRLLRSLHSSPRSHAVHNPGAPTLRVFDPHTKYLQKERAASNPEASRQVDYLRDEVARRLCERLLYIKRPFPSVLDLGSGPLSIARALTSPNLDPTTPTSPPITTSHSITTLTCTDTSPTLLHRDASIPLSTPIETLTLQPLPSYLPLPFSENTFDLVLSSMALHWINDLPTLLSSILHTLKPDAPFLAAMLGGDSLYELRSSLQLSDLERLGGVTQHISPLADVRDIGGLLTKAGFTMLTVDIDDIIVEYPDVFALMADLQAMGESNAVVQRRKGLMGLSRDVLIATEAVYRELYGEDHESLQGVTKLPATFRIIYMIGWKKGEGQPKPLERGSGEVNLKEILEGGGGVKGEGEGEREGGRR
ncbi:MAG: hypothetical protein M1834_000911 [Cirrosporium novae-zelandiae]|nr:MAG: hypothetical protein M1834_000911 [Cirrosporium novae-zelandiae]